MSIRFYLAPQQGDGTENNPFRSILNDLINVQQGDWFDEIDNPARHISLCCAHGPQAMHDTIALDSRVLPIGNICADGTALRYSLDSLLSGLSNLPALKTALETWGISTSWLSGSNTLRDGLRYVIRVFITGQIADGQGDGNWKALLGKNLTATFNSLTAAQRNAIRAWLASRGLAENWIGSTTTIREIVHFVVMNLGIGKLRMSGEDF